MWEHKEEGDLFLCSLGILSDLIGARQNQVVLCRIGRRENVSNQVKEATNRGNNLFVVGLLVFLACGVFAEIFVENELLDKADDIFAVLIAIAAVVWYLRGKNRFQYSWAPWSLLAVTFVAKVLAFINEHDDPAAVGDEFGVVIPLAVMVIVSGVILYRTHRQMAPSGSVPVPEIEQRQSAVR